MTEETTMSDRDMARQAAANCTSMSCRRMSSEPGCLGLHCPVCGGPCGQQGHPDCLDGDDDA